MAGARAPSAAPSPAAFGLRLPASPAYRWLLAGSLLFAVGNSSDMFILLKAEDVGLGTSGVILVYVLYNLVYAAASLPLGGLSDRVGQLPVVIGGYLVFAAVYAGFAVAGSWPAVAVLFAAYGLYIAATEGTSKALISRATPLAERASAIGLQATLTRSCQPGRQLARRRALDGGRAVGDLRLRRGLRPRRRRRPRRRTPPRAREPCGKAEAADDAVGDLCE